MVDCTRISDRYFLVLLTCSATIQFSKKKIKIILFQIMTLAGYCTLLELSVRQ